MYICSHAQIYQRTTSPGDGVLLSERAVLMAGAHKARTLLAQAVELFHFFVVPGSLVSPVERH